jgi:hypothetical protein
MPIDIEQIRSDFMNQLELDYKEKELLKPRNNREYWLFTEIWQRCDDLFKKLKEETNQGEQW